VVRVWRVDDVEVDCYQWDALQDGTHAADHDESNVLVAERLQDGSRVRRTGHGASSAATPRNGEVLPAAGPGSRRASTRSASGRSPIRCTRCPPAWRVARVLVPPQPISLPALGRSLARGSCSVSYLRKSSGGSRGETDGVRAA